MIRIGSLKDILHYNLKEYNTFYIENDYLINVIIVDPIYDNDQLVFFHTKQNQILKFTKQINDYHSQTIVSYNAELESYVVYNNQIYCFTSYNHNIIKSDQQSNNDYTIQVNNGTYVLYDYSKELDEFYNLLSTKQITSDSITTTIKRIVNLSNSFKLACYLTLNLDWGDKILKYDINYNLLKETEDNVIVSGLMNTSDFCQIINSGELKEIEDKFSTFNKHRVILDKNYRENFVSFLNKHFNINKELVETLFEPIYSSDEFSIYVSCKTNTNPRRELLFVKNNQIIDENTLKHDYPDYYRVLEGFRDYFFYHWTNHIKVHPVTGEILDISSSVDLLYSNLDGIVIQKRGSRKERKYIVRKEFSFGTYYLPYNEVFDKQEKENLDKNIKVMEILTEEEY